MNPYPGREDLADEARLHGEEAEHRLRGRRERSAEASKKGDRRVIACNHAEPTKIAGEGALAYLFDFCQPFDTTERLLVEHVRRREGAPTPKTHGCKEPAERRTHAP